jgi:hypothetical protein
MTSSTISWCDKCEKEVSKDHDCTKKHNLWKLVKHFDADK